MHLPPVSPRSSRLAIISIAAVFVCCPVAALPQTVTDLPLVFDDASSDRFKFENGVLRIKGGSGWVRTPRVFLDFSLALEFRSQAPETDAGVLFRTFTGADAW